MTPPTTGRRAVLRGVSGLVVLGAVTTVTSACAGAPEGPDELEAPLAAARADVALAAVVATRFPDLAQRLTLVTEVRRAHADALAAEVRRVRPDREEAVAAPAPAAPPAPPTTAAAVAALRESLLTARDAGAALALTTARYRSGLVASIAAACAGSAEALA